MSHYTSDLRNIFRTDSSAEGCMVSHQNEQHVLHCLSAASGQLKLFMFMNKVSEDDFFFLKHQEFIAVTEQPIWVFRVLVLYTVITQLYGFLLG